MNFKREEYEKAKLQFHDNDYALKINKIILEKFKYYLERFDTIAKNVSPDFPTQWAKFHLNKDIKFPLDFDNDANTTNFIFLAMAILDSYDVAVINMLEKENENGRGK